MQPTIEQARRALAQTVYDPTLRQLQHELYAKEQAASVADRALEAAETELARLRERIGQLERRLDDLDEPQRVRTVPAREVLEWERVEPRAAGGDG